jgi:hypothetical protein
MPHRRQFYRLVVYICFIYFSYALKLAKIGEYRLPVFCDLTNIEAVDLRINWIYRSWGPRVCPLRSVLQQQQQQWIRKPPFSYQQALWDTFNFTTIKGRYGPLSLQWCRFLGHPASSAFVMIGDLPPRLHILSWRGAQVLLCASVLTFSFYYIILCNLPLL